MIPLCLDKSVHSNMFAAAAAVPATGMRRAGRAPITIFATEGTSSRGAGRGLLGMGAVIAMVGFCLGSLTTVSILYCLFASDPFSNQATNLLEAFVDSESYHIDPSRAVLPDSLFGKVNNELACGALIHISSFKRVPRPGIPFLPSYNIYYHSSANPTTIC